jgi:hypothetical protein
MQHVKKDLTQRFRLSVIPAGQSQLNATPV